MAAFIAAIFVFAGFVSGLSLSLPGERLKSLTKSMIWQTETNPASQGGEAAKKGAYINVSDRILQPTPTQKAKMAAFLQPFLCLRGLSAV